MEDACRSRTGDLPWNERVIEDFRANGGRVRCPMSAEPAAPHLDRREIGGPHVAPWGYTRDGERYVVVGSNSGRPVNADWVANVAANRTSPWSWEPRRSTPAGGSRRAPSATGCSAAHVAALPHFAKYQAMTERQLPVVTLERIQ